jgi:hypothetical protein
MTISLVSTVTVGAGGAASMAFTSIPQTATDLYLVVSSRANGSGDFLNMTLNGSTASFSGRYLGKNGGSAFSGTNVIIGFTNPPSYTGSTFASSDVYISNYAGSTNKSFSTNSVQENNSATHWMFLNAGLWSNTAAITSLSVTLTGTDNFVQYSTASLYTITKGSGGATVT